MISEYIIASRWEHHCYSIVMLNYYLEQKYGEMEQGIA